MRLFFIFLTLNALAIPAWCQITDTEVLNDTIIEYEYDTVVVYEPPVVVRKEILIPHAKTNNAWSIFLSLGAFLYKNKYTFPSSISSSVQNELKNTIIPKLSFSGNVELSYGMKNIFFCTGLSFAILKANNVNSITSAQPIQRTAIDTVTFYYMVVGGDTSKVFVTDNTLVNDTLYSTKENTQKINDKYGRLIFQIGYNKKIKKFSYYGKMGLSLNYFLNARQAVLSENYKQKGIQNISPCMLGYAAGLGCSYYLNNKIRIGVEGFLVGDLVSLTTGNTSIARTLSGVNIGLHYFL